MWENKRERVNWEIGKTTVKMKYWSNCLGVMQYAWTKKVPIQAYICVAFDALFSNNGIILATNPSKLLIILYLFFTVSSQRRFHPRKSGEKPPRKRRWKGLRKTVYLLRKLFPRDTVNDQETAAQRLHGQNIGLGLVSPGWQRERDGDLQRTRVRQIRCIARMAFADRIA